MKKIFTNFLLVALLAATALNVAAQHRGTSSFADRELVKIYPNPVVSEANISISKDIDLERYRVTIVFYNIVGKEVLRLNNIKESDVRINRDAFVPGVYIYQMKIDDKVQNTGKISFK
jgi:hypothetical protein